MNYRQTDFSGYFKDKRTGFVLNTNTKDLQAYRLEVKKLKKMKNLENEVESMKAMLQRLLENGIQVRD